MDTAFAQQPRKRFLIFLLSLILAYTFIGQADQPLPGHHLKDFLIAESWQISLQTQAQSKPWPWAKIWPAARLYSDSLNQDIYLLKFSGQDSAVLCNQQQLLKLQALLASDDLSLQTMDGRWHNVANRNINVIATSENSQKALASQLTLRCFTNSAFEVEDIAKRLQAKLVLAATPPGH